MKRSIVSFIAAAGTLGAAGTLHSQENPYNGEGDPVYTISEEPPGHIVVGHYGYWLYQPVKMAYFTFIPGPGKQCPALFTLYTTDGESVFTGMPLRMTDTQAVFAPVAVEYPGEEIYALNFSSFNKPGRYFIRMRGVPPSMYFTIGGKLPADAGPLPGLSEFDIKSGLLPAGIKPIVDLNFLR